MPEHLNFFHKCHPRQQRNMSSAPLACNVARPTFRDSVSVSTLLTKVQSPAAWFPLRV